jgi:hypothetical protein
LVLAREVKRKTQIGNRKTEMESAKLCTSFLFLLLFFFIFKTPVFAEMIVINEFSSSAGNSSDPDWPDWVEVYYEDVDPALYQLKDYKNNVKNLSDGVCSDNFCTLEWSNKLDNAGDTIRLIFIANPDIVIDQVTYPLDVTAPADGQYAGRSSDGVGDWVLFLTNTKGSSNNTATLAPTPTHTPTPSPTITPTPTSIPEPTSKPTSTPTPTTAPTPTNEPTPTRAPTPTKSSIISSPTSVPAQASRQNLAADNKAAPISILGESSINSLYNNSSSDFLEAEDIFPTKKATRMSGNSENNLGKILIIIGVIFIIACGILAFRSYKTKKNDET